MEEFGRKKNTCLENRNFWHTAVFLFFLSFLVFFGKNLVFAADVPNVVTYQGKLLVNGVAATTTQSMKFVLYDSLSGGTALYSASGTIGTPLAVSTTVNNGFFTVNLGDTGTNSLDPAVFKDNSGVYLEVIIGGEILTPRKRLTAAPYAFNAKYLNGISATATPQSSVYIPVTDSGGKLNLNGVTSTALTVTGETSLTTTTLSTLNSIDVNGTTLNFINGSILFLSSSGTASFTALSAIGNSTLATTTISSSTVGYLNVTNNTNIGGTLSVTGNASLGTVASGTWNGNAISSVYGGTGQNSSGWSGFVKVVGGTWSTSSISVSDLSNSSTLAFLGNNQTFTGINNFSATSTFATSTFGGYVGIGTTTPQSGLHLYDRTLLVDNPVNPTLVGTTTLVSVGGSMYVSGNYLYSVNTDRFGIIDIRNKSNPIVVSSSTLIVGGAITVSGKYAYVLGSSTSTLSVVDVSNPYNPVVVGTLSGGSVMLNPYGIYISGKYAYVTGIGSNSIVVVDISNPVSPQIVGNLVDATYLNAPIGVYVAGNYAYVAGRDSKSLTVIDISNQHTPAVVGFVSSSIMNGSISVYVSGKYAYVASAFGQSVSAIDVSNPASPTIVGSLVDATNLSNPSAIQVSGKYAYVASGGFNFAIIDISNPASLRLVGNYNHVDVVQTLAVSGNYAYLGGLFGYFSIVNLKGADISAAEIGNLSTSALTVSENVDIGNNLYIRNGLNIGQGGLLSGGALAISVSSTVSTSTIFSAGTNTTSSILAVNADGTVTIKSLTVSGNTSLATTTISSSTVGYLNVTNNTNIGGTLSVTGNASLGTIASGTWNGTAISNAYGGTGQNSSGWSGFVKVVGGVWSTTTISTGDLSNSSTLLFLDNGNLNVAGDITVGANSTIQSSSGNLSIFSNDSLNILARTSSFSGLISIDSGILNSTVATSGVNLLINPSFESSPATSSWTLTSTGTGANYSVTSSAYHRSNAVVLQSGSSGFMTMEQSVFNTPISITTTTVSFYSKFITSGSKIRLYLASDVCDTDARLYYNFNTLGWDCVYYLSFPPELSGTDYFYDVSPTTSFQRTSVSFLSPDSNNWGTIAVGLAVGGDVAYYNHSVSVDAVQLEFNSSSTIFDAKTGSAFILNANNFISSTASDKLLSLRNNDTEKLSVSAVGDITMSGSISTSGTASFGTTTVSNLYANGIFVNEGKVSNPVHKGSLVDGSGGAVLNSPFDVFVSGNYAYLVSTVSDALEIVDVSNPANPVHKGSLVDGSGGAVLNDPRAVYVSGNYAYTISYNSSTLEIVDVSNPASPVHKGKIVDGAGGATLSSPLDVWVSGKYAYIAAYGSGALEIVDVSNPSLPIHVSSVAVNGIRAVQVSGNYAYVLYSSGVEKLLAIDVSNPANPVVKDDVTTNSSFPQSYMYVAGHYVYIGILEGSFRIYDISNPNNLLYVGQVSSGLGQILGVYVSGNYAYLASSGSNKLNIIDVSNPASPSIKGYLSNGSGGALLNTPTAVFVSGNYAYVASEVSDALEIVDVSGSTISNSEIGTAKISNLSVLGSTDLNGDLIIRGGLNVGVSGILLNGNFGFSGVATNTLSFSTTTLFENLATSTLTKAFIFNAANFSGSSGNSLLSIRAGNVEKLALLDTGALTLSSGITANATSTFVTSTFGGYVGIGTSTPQQKLHVYNGTVLVDNPVNPTLVGTTAFSGSPNVWSTYVSGKYGYAITTNGFETVNLDDKNFPSPLAHLALANVSAFDRSLFVSGNYAYATAGTTNTLYIVDVSNPASPSLLTTYQENNLLTGAANVYVSGNYAYVTANSTSTVSIVDIANPYSIRVVGHVTDATKLNSVTGIYVSGRYAYAVGYGNNYLVVIDVSDPANPSIVGSVTDAVNMNGPRSVYVSGKYAYVVSSVSQSMAVIDVSSPTSPIVVGSLVDATNLDSISSIIVAGKYAYVVAPANTGRMSVVDISVSSSPRFIGNTTNSNINGARSIFISGKYAYVASAVQSANFSVIDLEGADVSVATIGNISSNALTVWENVDVGNNLFVRSSVNIGGSLETNGPVAIAANLSNGSFFKISSSTNSAIFNISSNGNVSINTSSFGGTSYKLKIDAGGTGNGAIGVNGFIKATAYITATTTLDLAETYPINTNCFAGGNCPSDGDLVCVDSSIVSGVKKCSNGEVEKMVGIVSTEPGFLLGGGETLDSAQNEGKVKVALTGRVPTRVSSENGVINPGDKLTLSNIDGVAAKAVGEVPIVGVAMEAFSGPGQGNIIVFVNLGWQNQLYKALTLDTNSSTLNLGTNLLPYNFNLSGDFTMSDSALNKLIFNGVAQFDSKTLDTHAFIFNAENFGTSTDSYLLSLRSNNDPRFSVMANGDVRTNGSIYAASAIFGTSTNPGDLAERVDISTDENVEPGDVMSIDMDNSDTYRRSSAAYSETVAGVISTNPTIVVGNGKTKNTAVMAMVGRVPIKVSSENGRVKKGDLLVTATLPGYAMRYDSNKDKGLRTVSVIGLALEDMVSGETGKIMALVRTGWINNNTTALVAMKGDLQKLAGSQGVALDSNQSLNIQNVGGSLTYGSGNLNLQGNQLFNVSSIIGKNSRWFIDEQGRFITRLNTSQGDKDMYAMQSPNSEFVFSSSSQMIAGEVKVVFDQYVQEVIDGQQPIKINITLTSGEAKGIYVSEKSPQGFTVKELSDGHSNATFDWMVVATRKPEDPTNIPSVIDGLINNPSGVSIDSQNSNSSTTVSTGISLTSTSTQTPITPNTTNNNVVPSSQTLPQVDLAPVQTVVPFLIAPSQPTVQTPPTPIIPVVSAPAVEASPASAPAASTPPTAPSTGTTAP